MNNKWFYNHLKWTIILTLLHDRFIFIFAAGSWRAADDGDEEIFELRSSGDVPWREHLAQASSSPSANAPSTTTTTVSLQSHPRTHATLSLPLSFSQSQPLAQTSATTTETETSLLGNKFGSRFVIFSHFS